MNGRVFFIILFMFITLISFSDVKIDQNLFNSFKARSIGPAEMGGRVTAIDVVNKNKNIIYVGTANGGVWKSVNAGIIFKPIFDEYTMSIGAITIDQNNTDRVWVGTGECNVRNTVSVGTGLYLTEDGGKTWKYVGFKDSERIARIVVSPKNSKVVYVAVLGHLWDSNKERGLYKTEDNGKTWKKILYVDENTGCVDVEVDPIEPNIVYASMWQFRRLPWFFKSGGKGSGLYKSIDGGKTWKVIRRGLPSGNLGRMNMEISDSRPGTLYALIESKKTGLYRSDDAGENWKLMNSTISVTMRPFYFSNLEIDPIDNNKLYVGSLFLSKSKDGGKSFGFPMFGFSVHPDIHSIWIDKENPKHIILGCDGGIYESMDSGDSFRFISNLPISQFYHVSVDNDYPYNVYGGLQDNGSWYGPSSSLSSFGIMNKEWKNVGGGDGFYVFRHPMDKNIVYHSWQGGAFERFNEKTGETKMITPMPTNKNEPEYRYNWNAGVEISPNNPERIYIGAQFLFKSENRGESWIKISPDLTTNDPTKLQQEKSGGITIDNTTAENYCSIVAISESPVDENIIWVGTDDGNLHVTFNGGKTWENVVKNIKDLPKNTWCSSIETSYFDKNTVFVTFDGHRTGDMRPYVFMTDDGGKTWKNLNDGNIKGYCHIVRQDLKNKDLLFLGTEFGLFVSIDVGNNWIYMKKTLPPVGVVDMVIHPRESDLIIATHGRGIFILDDITAIRGLNYNILKEDVYVLPSRPTVMKIPTVLQEFPGNQQFFGSNPASGAYISYYLKKRPLFGKFKLEIFGSNGEKIKELFPVKNKGINRIYWDMRLKPPKVGVVSSLSTMINVGPMVDEGEYVVKITKGKRNYEGKIILVPDRLSNHSKEDRRLRKELVMKLYNLSQKLSYITDSLLYVSKNIEKFNKKYKKNYYKNKLVKIKKKFYNMYESYVQTKGIMAGKKLRERILMLYSNVIGYGGKPTNSQIFNANVLESKVMLAKQKFNEIIKRYLGKINKIFRKNNLRSIKIKTFENYKEKGYKL